MFFLYIDHDLLVIYEGYEMMKVEKKQRWALRQPCRRPQIPVATAGFEGNCAGLRVIVRPTLPGAGHAPQIIGPASRRGPL